MAPKRVKPLDKVLLDAATANLSEPRGQQLIFDYYKRVGYLPPKDAQGHTFKSLQEYLSAVQRLANQERSINPDANPNEWLRAAEARLGFNRQIRSAKTGKELSIVASRQLEDPKQKLAKNRVGSVFPLEIGEDGNVRFNKRKYMSAEGGLPRPVYDFIQSKYGTEVADTYQKAVRKEWKDMGDAGRKLAAETGIPFDRGHWLSNKYGGAESARAGALEIAKLNRLHGAAPRGNIEAIRETGRTSFGWLDDFYQWDLTNNKLNVLGSEHLKDADLQAISNGLDPNKIIAQRVGEWEARGRTPDPDSVGFIFGSQLDRDETIRQQQLRMMEEQLASISKTGIDPQTGNPVSPERLDELQKGARAAKKSTKLMPGGAALKTLGKAASVLPGVDPGRVEQIVNKTSPFAKGPTVVPAPTALTISMPPKSSKILRQAVSNIDPELVSQFSRQIGNRIDRRLGKSPFDKTLDTTSQKYLENIGKYQQFIDLDEASKAALGLYGENVKQYYADLNRQLRTGSNANLTPQQIAVNEFLQGNLSKALDTLSSEQRDLYRAIKDPVREGLVDLKVGDIYTDKGFGSFSADEKAALRFIRKDAPSALITVKNAEGKNIGPVMEFDEAEFLQKPGAQYRLESVDKIFSPKVGGTVPNYIFTQVTSQSLGQIASSIANREPLPAPKPQPKVGKTLGRVGKLGAAAAIGQALLSGNPAEAVPVAAETFTPLGDIQGAPEPAITMVNVNGKLRPLNTDTNTLMDKPGYGLEQKGGQWREVKRGTGAATKQQQQAIQQTVQQVTNLMPKVNKVVNPVGARITNEAQYFIVNPIRSAYDRIFGKRDI